MTAQLTLAEVDQLIEELDHASPERSDWRNAFDRLHQAYIRAHKFERMEHLAYGILATIVFLYFSAKIYSANWDLSVISPAFNFVAFGIVLSSYFAKFALSRFFPVLQRNKRVTILLRYFGAEIGDDARGELVPPEVIVALKALERANSPIGLRSAYETVEKWSFSQKRWNASGVFLGTLWLLALIVALSEDAPESWRGAAVMFIALTALYAMSRRMESVDTAERVEAALHRWRHLVPAMREAAP